MLLDLPSANEPLSERMRLIRFRMRKEHLRFSDELRVIPRPLIATVAILFALAELVAYIVSGLDIGPNDGPLQPIVEFGPKYGTLAILGMVAAVAIPTALILLLIGYVNRDAARRGMNSMLWTIFVIVLSPAFLLTGFIIYFLIREPLPYHCPKCGGVVTARYNFCPACKYLLHPTCAVCKHEVGDHDRFCARCGNDLTAIPSLGPKREWPLEPAPAHGSDILPEDR